MDSKVIMKFEKLLFPKYNESPTAYQILLQRLSIEVCTYVATHN